MTAARSSEFLVRNVIEDSPAPMALVAPDGAILCMNAAARHVTRMTREDLEEAHFFRLFRHPAKVRVAFDRALARDHPDPEVFELALDDDPEASLLFEFNAFCDDDGAVAGVFSVMVDISDSLRAERQLRSTSHYARSLLEASLDPLVTISVDGKIMDVNRATERVTGLPREALVGSDFSNYFTDPTKARSGYELVFSQGHVNDYPLALRHANGSVVEVLYNASTYSDSDGKVAGVFASARDVTLLQRSREELESTNREVLLLGQMSSLLQTCQSVDEAMPIVAATLQRLFTGSSGRCFLADADGESLEESVQWGEPGSAVRSIVPRECWALRRGHIHDIGLEESLNPPCHFLAGAPGPYLCAPLQAQGQTLGILHLLIGVEDRRPARRERIRHLAATAADAVSLALVNLRLRESLQALSVRDPLTGLYNRRFMEEALNREISRMTRAGKPLAIVMLDLDHFKSFNDSYGHDAGDAVLREVAKLMQGFRQGSDLACRYGGEEFLLILPELGLEHAFKRLEQFRISVGHMHVHLNGEALPAITVSIGVAIFPEAGRTAEELVKQADNALYLAKESGRNRVEIAHPGGSPARAPGSGIKALRA